MTAVVLVLLTLCVCFGIRSYAKKLRQGGGCCGEREPAEKKVAGARANVHCKEKPDLGQLKEAVRAGGYTVLSAECAEDARHAG